MQKRGFTLIEVLIAAGILFMVAGAVAGLTNTIVQGTSQTADNTETNRWASEGLELVTKVRNDSVAIGGTVVSGGEKIWFAPAFNSDDYGWYKLSSNNISLQNSLDNRLNFSALESSDAEKISSSSGLVGYRLICIEAFGAKSIATDNFIDCNSSKDSTEAARTDAADGNRAASFTDCDSSDNYCLASKASLNINNPSTDSQYFSLPGNVVRVRSVIIWQDREEWKTTEMSTLLTNWKGFEQN